jgi:hypothetical protein
MQPVNDDRLQKVKRVPWTGPATPSLVFLRALSLRRFVPLFFAFARSLARVPLLSLLPFANPQFPARDLMLATYLLTTN